MKVCWIGLGNMGSPMATHLSKAGYDVVGFDLSPSVREAVGESGLTTASSAIDAARGADIVFTMLPKGEHVHAAILESGVLDALAADALVVDCSTISTGDARAVAAVVNASGRGFLDAPVSGGTNGAENGTLTFMVGGTVDDLRTVRPLLSAMGSRIFRAGAVGAGQSAKLINNMMLAMNMQSLCESAVLAQKLDVDPQTVIEIAGASTGNSWVLNNYYPVGGAIASAPSSRDFTGGFAVTLMHKDLGLALDAAEEHRLELAATVEVSRRLQHLIDEGFGALDFSSLIRLIDGSVPVGVSQ